MSALILLLYSGMALGSEKEYIETKYLMFKLPVIYVEAIDKLVDKEHFKADFGNGAFLHSKNVRRIKDGLSSQSTIVLQIMDKIEIGSVALNSGCLMRFLPAKGVSFRLRKIECKEGFVEYANIKMTGVFSSFDTPTRNHFYAGEPTAESKVPLVGGKFLYPGDKVNVLDWTAGEPTTPNRIEVDRK